MPERSPPTARLISNRDLDGRFSDDVLIAPLQRNWNDFGYQIRAEVGLRRGDGEREWLFAFFALKGVTHLGAFFAERRISEDEGIPVNELGIPFASLLTESKSYSLVRRSVGTDQGRRMLLAINDVSLLNSEDEDVPGWGDFFAEEVFTHAMTRSSEGHFAFRQGPLVLAGRKTSEVDARQLISVDLTRYGPKVHFDFDFGTTSSLRGRMAVIIGKNGCGKTSSLSRLAAGFATDKRQGVSFEVRPSVNQVLVFAHSGAVRHFKQRRDRPGAASVRTFALDPSTALRTSARARHTRLLVDIARSVDTDFGPLEDLKSIIRDEFPGLKLFIPLRAGLEEPIPGQVKIEGAPWIDLQFWMRGTEGRQLTAAGGVDHEQDLVFLDDVGQPRALSLGQAAFLNFSLNALANAGPASILLVDEPENFLHPNLISRFMRVLHRIVEGTKSIAILATHSPFVVREVQSAHVHVIGNAENSTLEVVHPRLQTLGANVASIANEVFGDDLAEHLYELVLNEANIATMPFDQILDRFAGELSTEALMYLRRRQQELRHGEGENGV